MSNNEQQDDTGADAQVSALVVFSAPLVKSLTAVRLPPNYVGVSRKRPSSREVQSAWIGKDKTQQQQRISYTVKDENGTERRMTKKEKKERKLQLLLEKREAKRKRKAECLEEGNNVGDSEGTTEQGDEASNPDLQSQEDYSSPTDSVPILGESKASDQGYHQLEVNRSAIDEELADLRGDRDGVPPVALMPCMARQVHRIGISDAPEVSEELYHLDESLSQQWAVELKDSLKEAEEVRNQEDLRPMAYQLMPEAWRRLRPDTLLRNESISLDTNVELQDAKWSWLPVRRRIEPLDSDKNIIFALLHSRSELHISCGAKFGCDFLLYDGPRDERHAFGGLRVLSHEEKLPSAYNLHAFVRCLNTAGKLSLLAKVVRCEGESSCRVAIVDLALEKILSAPRHKQRSTTQTRRDVAKNLAKKGSV